MKKDLFARHTPVRSAGYGIRERVMHDVSFCMEYKRSECAEFFVTVDFGEFWCSLFGFRLSFCLACGRFLGFGTRYELCWICESDLELELEEDDELELTY
jgi:hypothetical protein